MLKPVKLITVVALALLAALASTQAFIPSANAAFTDTDGDGEIDLAEEVFGSNPNAAVSTPETSSYFQNLTLPTSCSDGLDNDGDGATDGADAGCVDSDGDSSFPDDIELRLGSDPHDDESYPEDSRFDTLLFSIGYLYSSCADEQDDDRDGLIDAADPGCGPVDADSDGFGDYVEKSLGSDWEDASSRPEHISINPGSCTDAIDNDSDTLTDGADEGCLAAPNDDLADAIVVDSLPFSHAAKAVGATAEPGERVSDCSGFNSEEGPRGTVWYQFNASSDMHALIDASGTDLLSSVSVWRQGSFGLEEVDCLVSLDYYTTSPRLAFEAAAGQTYLIQLERFFGPDATDIPIPDLARLSFHMEATEPPPNDDFADAAPITSLPFTGSVDTIAASIQAFEPEGCGYHAYPANSIWYRYAPTGDTYLYASAYPGTQFGVTVGVYEGTSLSSLTQVACGSELAFHARAGQAYYLQAAGYRCQSPVAGGEIASFCVDSRGGELELRMEAITVPSCSAPQFTIADRIGDQIDAAQPDIISVSSTTATDHVCVTVRLDRDVPLYDYSTIGFDLDQNSLTGEAGYAATVCRRPTGLGVDAEFFISPAQGLLVRPNASPATGNAYALVMVDQSSFTLILPVAVLGGDTDVGFVATAQSADCAPDGGHIACTSGACAFVPFRNGDANCVTGANAIDAAIVLQYGAGLLTTLACPDAADVDGNDVIDSRDAALILQYAAGLIDQLPPICQKPPDLC